jgi:hypothetical protein
MRLQDRSIDPGSEPKIIRVDNQPPHASSLTG